MSDGLLPASQRKVLQEVEVGLLEVTCPLCDGKGKLSRTHLYDQLGVRDMAKLATHTAKEAVAELTERLWGQYKDNLEKQVADQAKMLNRDIEELKAEKSELDAKVNALQESIKAKETAARNAQKNEDQAALLAEKQFLQDEIAELKGQVSTARAELEAVGKQRGLDVKEASERVKEELNQRIDQLENALLDERKKKAEIETRLERAQSELRQREHEAKTAAYEEKQKELDSKQELIDTMKGELAELRAVVQAFPEKETVAVQKAINEHESKLRKLELDRDTLQKERDGLREELADARQKLEDRKGKVEERTFEKLVAEVPGVWIEDWRSKSASGDYHVGLYDKDGEKLRPSKIVVDNKDVGRLTPKEIDKLIRDAHKHNVGLAAMVVSDESALRPEDLDARFGLVDGVTLLRTTREWFLRDLDLLKPLMRRQAEEGPDFMKRNVAVAAEVRSHLKALDKVENFMRLARENAEKAEKELKKYRNTIDDLCRNAGATEAGGDATQDASEEE
ncbi:MAG: hypothetical protein H6840_05290 [Planctomycetes bacterium]|nr:hypothetical protein [Planctomycetota bacterium]